MEIIALEAQKGGVGKTTVAVTLGAALNEAGFGPIVVVDLDPQSSLGEWFDDRITAGIEGMVHLVTTHDRLKVDLARVEAMGYLVAIIDTPGYVGIEAETARELATLVIIPTGPSPLDLRSIRKTIGRVKASGKPFMFALVRAKPRTKLTYDAMAMLSRTGPVAGTYGDLKDYPTAMINGRVAQEFNPKGAAAQEVRELAAAVIAQLNLTPPA